jgi:hypothetical protein
VFHPDLICLRLDVFRLVVLMCNALLFPTYFQTLGEQTMTIDELIARLEDYRDEIGGDAEVRLMTQQNWPFENSVYGLASGAEINDCHDDEDRDDDEDGDDAAEDSVLFIVEGKQLGYGTKRAWDVARKN